MSQKKKQKNEKTLTIRDHLSELRTRLLSLAIVFLAISVVAFLNSEKILSILLKPASAQIVLSSPTSSIEASIKVSLLFGYLISLPFGLYQLFRFVSPALPQKSSKFFINLTLSSFLLATTGAIFAYKVALPNTLLFLDKYGLTGTVKLYNLSDYLSFLYLYLAGFVLFSQIPVIILAINSFVKLNISRLISGQSYAIAVSFLLAGIITPTPDVFNQTIMALPAIMLYELSILLVWLQNKNK